MRRVVPRSIFKTNKTNTGMSHQRRISLILCVPARSDACTCTLISTVKDLKWPSVSFYLFFCVLSAFKLSCAFFNFYLKKSGRPVSNHSIWRQEDKNTGNRRIVLCSGERFHDFALRGANRGFAESIS